MESLQALATSRGAQNVVEMLELGKKMQVLVFCFLILCLVTQETEA